MNKLRFVIYVRRSSESEDRQVASIDSQLNVLRKIASERNLKIVSEYTESKSAKNPGRTEFQRMIDDLYNQKADAILCWKLDRLARNAIDGGAIMHALQNKHIKLIRTSEREYQPEDNVLLMAVEFGMANQFIQDLRQNTRRGVTQKAERGWFPSQAPIGYKSNPTKKKGNKEIIIDPDRFYSVRRLFDLMLTGNYSVTNILRIATNELNLRTKGNKKLHLSNVFAMLRNTFYYGDFEYPKGSGNWYKGIHEPMITRNEFNIVQQLLGEKGRPRPKKHHFPFTGMIRCGECGMMVTAEFKTKKCKNGNIHRYVYYHCSKRGKQKCTQKTIEIKDLERQITEYLESIYLPDPLVDWALEVLKRLDEKEKVSYKKQIETLFVKKMKIKNRLSLLIDFILDGDLSKTDYEIKKKELQEELDSIENAMVELERRESTSSENAEEVFVFANSAISKFTNGSDFDKKSILSAIGSNLSLFDRKLGIELKKPFSLLRDVNSSRSAKRLKSAWFEPRQPLDYRGHEGDLLYMKEKLYPRQDSNL